MVDTLSALQRECTACRACPRLVAHREQVARTKRRAFQRETYWGRPVAGFGDPAARIVLVGLAPGAHGSNRTGRPFTGDASGDFLYPALHRAGLASQPQSTGRDDRLQLLDTWITAAVRCAPPDNRPTGEEFQRCRPWLERELALLPRAVVYVALGQLALDTLCRVLPALHGPLTPARPRFAHGAQIMLGTDRWIVASYHPSRQNTQTGRLTAAMFDTMLGQVLALAP